jgi:porin
LIGRNDMTTCMQKNSLIRGLRRSLPALAAVSFNVAAAPLTPEQFDAQTLTGDWGGLRSDAAQAGYDLRADYVSETLGVPVGGLHHSTRYTQQVRVGVDVRSEPVFGYDGGTFRVTINDRRGNDASGDLVGNRFPIQEAYGAQYTRLSELSYDQKFNGNKSYFKLGFYAMGNQFASHTLLLNFVNAAFCAHPLAFMGNSGWYNYPAARWGAEAAQQVTPTVNVRVGWFQVNPNLRYSTEETYAFALDADGTTGSLFPVELTWTPGVATNYAGVYKFGGYYDTSTVAKKGVDAGEQTGRHGSYVLAEQKLFTPAGASSNTGLTAFAQYMISDHATAQITHWYAVGGVWQGIGSRAKDRISLGYVGADINQRLLDVQRLQLQNSGVPTDSPLYNLTGAEQLYELAYSYQVNPWLMLRPDAQYIVDPGTYSYRQTNNALAVGLQIKLTF